MPGEYAAQSGGKDGKNTCFSGFIIAHRYRICKRKKGETLQIQHLLQKIHISEGAFGATVGKKKEKSKMRVKFRRIS